MAGRLGLVPRRAAMQQAGFPLAIARPKEGAVVLMTAGCAITDSPEPALADKFLAYLVSPKVQEIFATPVRGEARPTGRRSCPRTWPPG
ncbi:extracellular solute-binding protein [Methylobacterium oryzae CBMB20]